jgi:ferrous iron transport protein A
VVTNLERLAAGKTAVVVGFDGGHGLLGKADAMGLRVGKKLRKLSSQLMAGPVTVIMDGRQLAMGRGIARKILVKAAD